MDRVAEPLGLMGAEVSGRGERCLPTAARAGRLAARHRLDVQGGQRSGEVGHLAGRAVGQRDTVVREAVTTRTHTEEMLVEAGADLTVEPWGEGRVVDRARLERCGRSSAPCPGDPSAAAFFVVAGCVAAAGSEVEVAGVYDGPARLGFISRPAAHGGAT